MKPLFLAFMMMVQCQGVEKQDYEFAHEQDRIEMLVEEFIGDMIQIVGEDRLIRVTFVGVNEEGDVFCDEVLVDNTDDLDKLIEELER